MTRILTVLVLAALTIGQVGCGCRRPLLSWWNRGDSCEVCAPPDCASAPGAIPVQQSMLQMPTVEQQLFSGGEQLVGPPIVTDGIPVRSRAVYAESLPQPR